MNCYFSPIHFAKPWHWELWDHWEHCPSLTLGITGPCCLVYPPGHRSVISFKSSCSERNFLGTKAWDINIAVQIKLQIVSKKGDYFTQGLRDYTALSEALFRNLYLKSMNSSCLMREAPIHTAHWQLMTDSPYLSIYFPLNRKKKEQDKLSMRKFAISKVRVENIENLKCATWPTDHRGDLHWVPWGTVWPY